MQIDDKQPPSNESIPAPVKRAYTPPVLRVYGAVSRLTQGTNGSFDDGMMSEMTASDPAVKENIIRVGMHPTGFGLYLFDYKEAWRDEFGHGRHFGVMADEVMRFVPSAVQRDDKNILRVDYSKIGVQHTRH